VGFILCEVQDGVADNDVGEGVDELHLLDGAYAEVGCGERRRQLGCEGSYVLYALGICIDGEDLAAFTQEVDEVSSVAAACVEDTHSRSDVSSQDLIEDIDVDLPELLLYVHCGFGGVHYFSRDCLMLQRLWLGGSEVFNLVAFPGGEEEIGFEAVLAGVEVIVATVEGVEGLMGATFEDASLLDDQDLVGAADGGEAVGDDKGGTALHEEVEAALDEGFGFGVEGAGGLVEDEDTGVGQDGAGDGEALALAAGEFDAALADDGVVLLGEAVGELVYAGDPAGVHELLFGGLGAAEEDVLADGAVEEEGLLQDDAQLLTVVAEAEGGQVGVVDEDLATAGGVKAADEGDDGGLAGAGGAYEGGDGAGLGLEADAVQDGLAGFVGEDDVLEDYVALDGIDGVDAGGLAVLLGFGEDLGGAVEAGEGFGELGADADELGDGRDHEGEEHGELDVAAYVEAVRGDLLGAEVHDETADDAEDHGGGERHEGLRGDGADDVLEETIDAHGEDTGFALFGVIALDDADAAERFGKAAGNLGVDLGAFAEDGPYGLEGLLQDETEDDEDAEGQQRHAGADADQDAERDDGGEDAADEFEKASAYEVADAFDVGHDAGYEGAGTVLVVEGDGEPADVLLDAHAQLRDEALAGGGEKL
jgi:hypothetical protein